MNSFLSAFIFHRTGYLSSEQWCFFPEHLLEFWVHPCAGVHCNVVCWWRHPRLSVCKWEAGERRGRIWIVQSHLGLIPPYTHSLPKSLNQRQSCLSFILKIFQNYILIFLIKENTLDLFFIIWILNLFFSFTVVVVYKFPLLTWIFFLYVFVVINLASVYHMENFVLG